MNNNNDYILLSENGMISNVQIAIHFLAEELSQIFKSSDGPADFDWNDLFQTESDGESRYVQRKTYLVL